MKKLNLIAIISIIMAVTFAGCKKYEDGPSLSLKSKTARLARTWQIDKVTLDGIEMTPAEIAMDEGGTEVTNEFMKDGMCNVSMMDSSGTMVMISGSWAFTDNDKAITISGMMGQDSETSTILRLTSSEFWYWHMDGTEKMEMHWKAK